MPHWQPILACVLALSADGAAEEAVFHHENVMGTSLELRVRADDAAAARWAEGRVLAEIDRLSAIFNGYDPSSEFSRWQAGPRDPSRVSDDLYELLEASDRWRAASGGAFDPRVQALTGLWSRSAKEGRVPMAEETAEARSLMARPAWRLDARDRTAERLSDCPLSLNAIAKGYIVERACAAALDAGRGVRGLLLNVGGDMRVCGDLAATIGVASPVADSETTEPIALIEVRDRAVATSGNYQRGERVAGRRYSHIFDPRSGRPADKVASATVIAGRSADADALATIFNVLDPEESLRLVGSLPDVECLIVAADGRVTRSPGWGRYEKVRMPAIAFAETPKAGGQASKEQAPNEKENARDAWGNEFELAVDFEINRPESQRGRYRRPYVVVWVEDKNGFPVRTILMWVSSQGAGPERWLPDLTRWYRAEQERKQVEPFDVVHTTSRATRPPGKYSAVWDGKDNLGKPLPKGEYWLSIEAAREHGTYQEIRKKLTIADKPFSEELKGNVEIKAASIAYRRKTPAK